MNKMCAYMCASVYVCITLWLFACVCAHGACMHVFVQAYMHVCGHMCVCVCMGA